MTYSKVGLDSFHCVMTPDIFNHSRALLRKFPGVTTILLNQLKDGFNGSLVYFEGGGSQLA